MPIEPWWETKPAATPHQELGMVLPELHDRPSMPNPVDMHECSLKLPQAGCLKIEQNPSKILDFRTKNQ